MKKTLIILITSLFVVELANYFGDYIPVATLKVLLVALSVCCYLKLIKMKSRIVKSSNHRLLQYMLFLYLSILLCRLYYDFTICGIDFFAFSSSGSLLFLYLTTIVAPVVFFCRNGFAIPMKKLAWTLGLFLGIILMVSLRNIMVGRVDATLNGQFALSENMDIIFSGYLGVCLFYIGLFLLKNADRYKKTICYLFMVVGFMVFTLSGERGPFLCWLICLALSLVLSYDLKFKNLVIYVVFIFVAVHFIPSLIGLLSEYFENKLGINTLYKITEILESGTNSFENDSRFLIFAKGMEEFWDSPVFGSSYLMSDKTYVHNIFIEAFMATGIIGGFLFIIISLKTLLIGYKLAKYKDTYVLIYIMFVIFFVFGLFSRSQIMLAPYWLFMSLIISCDNYEKSICCNTNI